VSTSQEASIRSRDDRIQLDYAHRTGAVLVTKNVPDFVELHEQFQQEERMHSGIILLNGMAPLHVPGQQIERAARVLSPASAANRLLRGEQFATDELAQATAQSLEP
jgi:hypothetical protein